MDEDSVFKIPLLTTQMKSSNAGCLDEKYFKAFFVENGFTINVEQMSLSIISLYRNGRLSYVIPRLGSCVAASR